MFRVVRITFLVLLFLLGLATAQAPDSQQDVAKALVEMTGIDSVSAQRIASQAMSQTLTAATLQAPLQSANLGLERTASLLEQPGTSLSYGLNVGRELKVPITQSKIQAGADVGSSGYGLTVKQGGFDYQASVDPSSRTLSSTAAVGAAVSVPLGPNRKLILQRVVTSKFEYADNRSFARATVGFDTGSIPGGETAHKVMQALAGRSEGSSSSGAVDTVLKTAFPNREGFLDTKSVVVGQGYRITIEGGPEKVGGAASIQILDLERLGEGQKVGQGTAYAETSLGLGVSTSGASYNLGVGLNVTRTTDPAASKRVDPQGFRFAQALRVGEVGDVVSQVERASTILRTPDLIRKGLDRLENKLGGVHLYHDPELLSSGAPPEALLNALTQIAETEPSEPMILRAQGESRLKAIEFNLDRDPLPLTSVSGFMRANDGTFWLLGEERPGYPKIALDDLTVALHLIWNQGLAPAISLDPIPPLEDYPGPQKVRTIDVPDPYRNTAFIKTLVEADYAMKRLVVGEDELPGLNLPSGRTPRSNSSRTRHRNRFWFYPSDRLGTEVFEIRTAERQVVYFESGVSLLTERDRMAWDPVSMPEHGVDPHAERIVESFNQNYRAIQRHRPVFVRLNQAFQLARLASVLRLSGVEHPVLTSCAQRPPRQVKLPLTYPGIGPFFRDGTFAARHPVTVAGGASCVRPLDQYNSIPMSGQIEKVGQGYRFAFPAAVPLSEESSREVEARQLIRAAGRELAHLEASEALKKLDKALSLNPGSQPARALKSKALFLSGRPKEALREAKRLPPDLPQTVAVKGFLMLYTDQGQEGLAALESLAAQRGSDPDFLGLLGMGQLFQLQYSDCRETLTALTLVDPESQAIPMLSGLLEKLEALPPAQARETVDSLVSLPYPTIVAIRSGLSASGKEGRAEAIANLERAQREQDALTADNPFARDACQLALAIIEGKQGNNRAAAAILDPIAAAHPEWTVPGILLGVIAYEKDPEAGLSSYLRLSQKSAAADPFMRLGPASFSEEMVDQSGCLMVLPLLGQLLKRSDPPAPELLAQLQPAVALLARRLPDGPSKFFMQTCEPIVRAEREIGLAQMVETGRTFEGKSADQLSDELISGLVDPRLEKLAPSARMSDIQVVSWVQLMRAGESDDSGRAVRLMEQLRRPTRSHQEIERASGITLKILNGLAGDQFQQLSAPGPLKTTLPRIATICSEALPPKMTLHRHLLAAECQLQLTFAVADQTALSAAERKLALETVVKTCEKAVAAVETPVDRETVANWYELFLERTFELGITEDEALELFKWREIYSARLSASNSKD